MFRNPWSSMGRCSQKKKLISFSLWSTFSFFKQILKSFHDYLYLKGKFLRRVLKRNQKCFKVIKHSMHNNKQHVCVPSYNWIPSGRKKQGTDTWKDGLLSIWNLEYPYTPITPASPVFLWQSVFTIMIWIPSIQPNFGLPLFFRPLGCHFIILFGIWRRWEAYMDLKEIGICTRNWVVSA